MLTYQTLSARPAAFQSMIGLSVSAFDELYAELAPAHAQRLAQALTKRHRQPRKRAVGAGNPHRHSLQDRLLLTLVWLRVYPTLEVLGFFFSLDKTNAEDNLKDVLATLDTMTRFVYQHPGLDPQRAKKRSAQAVMDAFVDACVDAFPDVALVVDAKEQRIQRPSGEDAKGNSRQKPFYSGKKKAHTLKNEESAHLKEPGGPNRNEILLLWVFIGGICLVFRHFYRRESFRFRASHYCWQSTWRYWFWSHCL